MVVHHGGTGTTSQCLLAEVPSVGVPFFGDQPLWAKRIYEIGAGAKPIDAPKFSVETLVEAINELSTNDEIKVNVKRIAFELRKEDGVKNAVELANKYIGDFYQKNK